MNQSTPRFTLALPLLLGACLCASGHAGSLSADEQKMVSYTDAHTVEAITLFEQVVNIESPTEDVAGVKRVGAVFKQEFESLGLGTKWIDMPAEMQRAGHLTAETGGSKGKRLLLIGHIDTVLRGEKFRREGDKAYGTGTDDMKGGAVVVLYALKALHAAGALQDTRIKLMFTGDEEDAGTPHEASRRDMLAMAKDSDAVLSFESAVRNTATVGRRGVGSWKLEVSAKTGHSGQVFSKDMGHGAIFEVARIINQFHTQLSGEKYLTFNPSVIVGGTTAELADATGTATGKTNVVPAKVIVNGDVRFISAAQQQSAASRMRDIVAQHLPGTAAEITFLEGYPAMTPNAGNDALLRELDQVSQDLGFGVVEALDPSERGAGDIAFVSHLLPALDGIGAGQGGNSHAAGEWVDLATFPQQIKRAALLIYRLTR